MVQLKVQVQCKPIAQPHIFQFLHGTIKSLAGRYPADYVFDFNSFMVQLKEGCGGAPFQIRQYFNSFMVQLKDAWKCSSHIAQLFQFLHGTIKSQLNENNEPQKKISIPSWYN